MTNGDIPNESIRSSNTYTIYKASDARIGGASKWAASDSAIQPWIQADIGYTTYISGIVTQGDDGVGLAGWVTTLKVSTFLSSITDDEVFIEDEHGTVMVRIADAFDFSLWKTTVQSKAKPNQTNKTKQKQSNKQTNKQNKQTNKQTNKQK